VYFVPVLNLIYIKYENARPDERACTLARSRIAALNITKRGERGVMNQIISDRARKHARAVGEDNLAA